MKQVIAAATAVAALGLGTLLAAHSIRAVDNCPKPSAVSVSALFAPCQAFAASAESPVPESEAMAAGFTRSDRPGLDSAPRTRFAAQ